MSPLGDGRGGRRKGWENISERQRTRYVRAAARRGWSEADIRQYYTAGGDMAAFRGHGTTPERPGRAARQPERYGDYRRRRTRYLRVVTTGGVRVLPVWNQG